MTALDAGVDVETAEGIVRGRLSGNLLSWKGIPYAAPPTGRLRLRAPEVVTAWSGVRDATAFGPPAPQRRRRGSENCLTLNVLRAATPGAARPVMVYIHGGAHTAGTAANHSGASLVRRGDIVFVTLNYRLGALGYLDFREFSGKGHAFDVNPGLLDQIAALRWVRRNIAAFGGDPSNVTLFGESAGADAVLTLMCTPAARGLFDRAIAQSPPPATANSPERAALWAREFLDLAGVPYTEADAFLTTAPPELLVRTAEALGTRAADEVPGIRPFAPVVDGRLLPARALEAFEAGSAHPIPLIIGTTAFEGRIFPRFLDILPTDPTRISKMFEETDPAVVARVTGAYPGYPGRRACADLGGDAVFWEPSLRCAHAHTRGADTYMYRYDFAPRLLRLAGLGATHATDLFPVFGGHDRAARAVTALGGRRGMGAVTEVMQRHWLAFAHTGAPADGWPRYSQQGRETLIIDTPCRVESDPLRSRREAWHGYRHRYQPKRRIPLPTAT